MELIGTFPTTLNPDENFNITILDTLYQVRQLWNTLGFWTLSFKDEAGVDLVLGVKIVSGIFILQQYPELPFDIKIDANIDPTRDDLIEFVLEVYSK